MAWARSTGCRGRGWVPRSGRDRPMSTVPSRTDELAMRNSPSSADLAYQGVEGPVYDESRRLLERARRVDASFLLRPGVLAGPDDTTPLPVFAERAAGAYLWDV